MELVQLWPWIFTCICLLLFGLPSFTLIYISRQPAVDYLGTNLTSLTLIIPVVLACAHWSQYTHGPSKAAIVTALVVPSLILGFVAQTQTLGAGSYVDGLFSLDCDLLPAKAKLQLEWEHAQDFFIKCTNVTATKSNFSTDFLTNTFRIQDCAGYQEALAKNSKSWSYLQRMEENYACTGFCVPGKQLWSNGPHKDSCSVALANIFHYSVYPLADLVSNAMIVMLVPILIVSCCW